MRWYVQRHGQTVGPVDDSQVAQWVRQGMTDAWICPEGGQQWVPIAQTPFMRPAAKTPSKINKLGVGCAALAILILGASLLAVVSTGGDRQNQPEASQAPDLPPGTVGADCRAFARSYGSARSCAAAASYGSARSNGSTKNHL